MAQYTVQAPDGKTITLEGPEGASHADVIAQAQKLYTPPTVDRTQVHTSFGATGDALAGVGGSFAQHAVNIYDLLRKIPGADKVLPDSAKLHQAIADATPDNTPSHIGQFLESAGEYLYPAAKAADLTNGARLAARMAGQGAAAGGVRAVQGGDLGEVTDAAALGAAGPAVGAAVGSVAPKVAAVVPQAVKTMVLSAAGKYFGLPLAKVAGMVEAAIKAAPTAEGAAPALDPLLDGIAQGFKYKDFASAPEDAKVIIQNLARATSAPPAPRPVPARQSPPEVTPTAQEVPVSVAPAEAVNGSNSTSVVSRETTHNPDKVVSISRPAPSTPMSKSDLAKRALADEMLKSGTATPEMLEVPDETALADMMRELPAGSPKAIAKANYAGNQEPQQAAAVYESAGRAAKAQNLATMLHDEGVAAKDVVNWDIKKLNAAARDRGMKTPFSIKSAGELIQQLRKMEGSK